MIKELSKFNKNRVKLGKDIIKNYKDVEFHLKNGVVYHAKNFDEFKKLIFAI